MRFPRRGGFTLAEILVAISLLMVLGGMLVLSLSSGVDTWRTTEARRVLYAESQMVLNQVERDLMNVAAPRPGETGEPAVQFLADFDANGRPRLRFVRTLKGEDAEEATRDSGIAPPDKAGAVYDFKGPPKKGLRALGGLMEVAYYMDPDPKSNVLFRAVRSPVGGLDSLFVDRNLASRERALQAGTAVADGVLYLGFHFWTQHTTTWDLRTPLTSAPGSACGPEVAWDSTRGRLPGPKNAPKGAPAVFWLAVGEASLEDPADDVFPSQVRVLVSVAAGGGAPHATLAQELGRKDRRVQVNSASTFPTEDDPDLFRYVRVGNEWIHYKGRTSAAFELDGDGRGVRGSPIQSHAVGEEVWGGRTFIVTVRIPSDREYWSGPEMSKMLARHAPPDPPWIARGKQDLKDEQRKKPKDKEK